MTETAHEHEWLFYLGEEDELEDEYSLSINAICLDYGKHLCHFSYLKLLSAPFHTSSLSYYTYMWLYCMCVHIHVVSSFKIHFRCNDVFLLRLDNSSGYYRGAALG